MIMNECMNILSVKAYLQIVPRYSHSGKLCHKDHEIIMCMKITLLLSLSRIT